MGATGKKKTKEKPDMNVLLAKLNQLVEEEQDKKKKQAEEEEAKKKAEEEAKKKAEEEEAAKNQTKTDDFVTFNTDTKPQAAEKWFNNPEKSNHAEWEKNLSSNESGAIDYYTGNGFVPINEGLYNTPVNQLPSGVKSEIQNLHDAISKFELKKGINTVRQCGFQIFGGKKGQKMTVQQVIDFVNANNGTLQINGFLSSTTKQNGTYAKEKGVWLDIKTPANKGGCAYVTSVGGNYGESEVLHNNNSVFKVDVNSIHIDSKGYVHATMEWIGQAAEQSFKNKKS